MTLASGGQPCYRRRVMKCDAVSKPRRVSPRRTAALLAGVLAAAAASVGTAHHSFAVYDFDTQIPFEGVVDTLKFRNPHIEMTLKRTLPDGKTEIINFVEGAPANMAVRGGLKPEMIKPGTKITATGSPRKDDPNAYFLRRVKLEDGREFL